VQRRLICRSRWPASAYSTAAGGCSDPEGFGPAIARAGREFPTGHAGILGSRLERAQRREPRAGDGAHLRLRPDRTVSRPPGFGRIANAFGGLSYLAGYPDRPPVTPGSATLPDYLSGLYGAIGALLALRTAEQSGVGQMVDIGLYESIFRILDEGATHPRMMSIGLHPRLIGQASRIHALRAFIEYSLGKGRVWFCRRIDIARLLARPHHAQFTV